jgi:hypothetical protein
LLGFESANLVPLSSMCCVARSGGDGEGVGSWWPDESVMECGQILG